MKKYIVISFTFLIFAVIGCQQEQQEPENIIVTSISVYQNFIQEIVGDAFQVYSLVEGLENPHTLDLTGKKMQLVENAGLLVFNGMGLESWANQLTSGEQDVKVVMVADSLRNNPIVRHGDNPHIWMDPQIAQDIIHVLLSEVQQVMPDSADVFQQNAETYIENLNRLYRDINTKLDPVKGERLIAQTPALAYYFSAFGIEQAGVIVEHPGGQPSAQHMTSLSNELSSGDILGIVHLPQFSENLPQTLSDETDVPVISMSALITGLEYVGTYLDLMWYNADQLESLVMTGV
ncbi:MAG: hypothetical protein GF372_02415 [Candidatus Marinimicrobia bacterium]|nr:hypothetical protein [Candidatus Neomarinimicrobiota bacterium]